MKRHMKLVHKISEESINAVMPKSKSGRKRKNKLKIQGGPKKKRRTRESLGPVIHVKKEQGPSLGKRGRRYPTYATKFETDSEDEWLPETANMPLRVKRETLPTAGDPLFDDPLPLAPTPVMHEWPSYSMLPSQSPPNLHGSRAVPISPVKLLMMNNMNPSHHASVQPARAKHGNLRVSQSQAKVSLEFMDSEFIMPGFESPTTPYSGPNKTFGLTPTAHNFPPMTKPNDLATGYTKSRRYGKQKAENDNGVITMIDFVDCLPTTDERKNFPRANGFYRYESMQRVNFNDQCSLFS